MTNGEVKGDKEVMTLAVPWARRVGEAEEITRIEEAQEGHCDNVVGVGEEQEATGKNMQLHLLENPEDLQEK